MEVNPNPNPEPPGVFHNPMLALAIQVRAATSVQTRAVMDPGETTASTASTSAWAAPKVAGKAHRGAEIIALTSHRVKTSSRRILRFIPLVSVASPVLHPNSKCLCKVLMRYSNISQ